MKMYEVSAKCGHVGMNYYIVKTFAVMTESRKEAAAQVKAFPRVKHDRKDAIISVVEIDQFRYMEIRESNRHDPYFSCTSIQEQRALCRIERFREVERTQVDRLERQAGKRTYYNKMLVRNAKKYMNNYIDQERYAG